MKHEVYVLCCWGGVDALEPLVAVFPTQEAAYEYCMSLTPMEGGDWFIERHRVGDPRATENVQYATDKLGHEYYSERGDECCREWVDGTFCGHPKEDH